MSKINTNFFITPKGLSCNTVGDRVSYYGEQT